MKIGTIGSTPCFKGKINTNNYRTAAEVAKCPMETQEKLIEDINHLSSFIQNETPDDKLYCVEYHFLKTKYNPINTLPFTYLQFGAPKELEVYVSNEDKLPVARKQVSVDTNSAMDTDKDFIESVIAVIKKDKREVKELPPKAQKIYDEIIDTYNVKINKKEAANALYRLSQYCREENLIETFNEFLKSLEDEGEEISIKLSDLIKEPNPMLYYGSADLKINIGAKEELSIEIPISETIGDSNAWRGDFSKEYYRDYFKKAKNLSKYVYDLTPEEKTIFSQLH